MPGPRALAPRVGAAAILLAALAGCGEQVHLPAAPMPTGVTATTVAIVQMGNADVTIDNRSVSFELDAARHLVVHLSLVSTAASTITVGVRASLYDAGHNIIGDATGPPVMVTPSQPATVVLNGPTPLGSIAGATFEVSAVAPGS